MAISVTIADPKINGLDLMSPTAPEFDSLVRSLFNGNSDDLLKLKPFLTVLSNHRNQTLVAYTLAWVVTSPTGRKESRLSQHKYPDALAPASPRRGNEIRSGEQKIVAMGIEIACGRWGEEATEEFYLHQFINWFKEYKEASALEISFDAAIFEDGEFFGPNKSGLDQHFKSYVDAKQDYYRAIVKALDAGLSLDEAFAPIDSAAKAEVRPGLDLRGARSMWNIIAAQDVRRRRPSGEEVALAIYRGALRTEPFEIKGSTSVSAPKEERILSHILCPRCGSSPKSSDRWRCKCGHQWNTFDTRGLCPACGHQWTETACPVCGALSPHPDWYIGQ